MANATFDDNKKEYTKRLNELKKRYQEKLKSALDDAREKFRFTVSELVLKEISKGGAASSEELAEALKNKSEVIGVEREAIKRLVKTTLSEVLVEYVKELTALNAAFDESPDLSARTFYINGDPNAKDELNELAKLIGDNGNSADSDDNQIGNVCGGLKNDDCGENNVKNRKTIGVFCPNECDDLN